MQVPTRVFVLTTGKGVASATSQAEIRHSACRAHVHARVNVNTWRQEDETAHRNPRRTRRPGVQTGQLGAAGRCSSSLLHTVDSLHTPLYPFLSGILASTSPSECCSV